MAALRSLKTPANLTLASTLLEQLRLDPVLRVREADHVPVAQSLSAISAGLPKGCPVGPAAECGPVMAALDCLPAGV